MLLAALGVRIPTYQLVFFPIFYHSSIIAFFRRVFFVLFYLRHLYVFLSY